MKSSRAFNGQIPPAVVSIGITLEDDGWWLYCPECDIAIGPYADRAIAARERGRHLTSKHGAPNFSASHPARAAEKTRRKTPEASR